MSTGLNVTLQHLWPSSDIPKVRYTLVTLVTGLRDTAHVSRAVGPLCDVSLGAVTCNPTPASTAHCIYLYSVFCICINCVTGDN